MMTHHELAIAATFEKLRAPAFRKAIEQAVRAEIQRQFAEVYMWDRADEDLFQEGEREWTVFANDVRLADRFDLSLVAAKVQELLP